MQRSSSMPVKARHLEARKLKRSEERETLVPETHEEIEVILTAAPQDSDNKHTELKNSSSCGTLSTEDNSVILNGQEDETPHISSIRPAEDEETITGPAQRNYNLRLRVIDPIRRLFRRISENVEENSQKTTAP